MTAVTIWVGIGLAWALGVGIPGTQGWYEKRSKEFDDLMLRIYYTGLVLWLCGLIVILGIRYGW